MPGRWVAADKELKSGVAQVPYAYLCECILLLWGDHDISEQEGTMLVARVSTGSAGDAGDAERRPCIRDRGSPGIARA